VSVGDPRRLKPGMTEQLSGAAASLTPKHRDRARIVTSDRGRERLLTVTQAALVDLQNAVVGATSGSWPSHDDNGQTPEPHAAIAGDTLFARMRFLGTQTRDGRGTSQRRALGPRRQ
jgi:hypothetical protein